MVKTQLTLNLTTICHAE